MELRLATNKDLIDPQVQQLMHTAVETSGDNIDVEYVLLSLDGKKTLMWVVEGRKGKGVIFTTILQYGKSYALLIWLTAGNTGLMTSKPLQEALEDVARRSGCSEVTAVVTNEKLLKHLTTRLGYKTAGVVVRKEISNVGTDTSAEHIDHHLN